MSFITNKLSKFYKSRKVNILIAFALLALLFSLLTKLSKNYTRTISFSIEMLHVPDEHVILNDTLHTINVTLTTYGFNLLKYYFVNPKLKVDFKKLKEMPNYYLWTNNDQFQNVANQFSPSNTINGISPDSIHFNYDSYSVKTIPVILKEDVTFASGFDVEGKYQLQPDSIKVIGAKVVVDSIKYVETLTFELNDINSNINASVKLNIPENIPDVKFSETEVIVSGIVKKFTEGSVMVPVTIMNLPKNVEIKYFPKEVEVIFYTSLDYYKTISVNNFRVECDYSKLDAENNKLIPKITKQPDSVRNVRLDLKSIEFILL